MLLFSPPPPHSNVHSVRLISIPDFVKEVTPFISIVNAPSAIHSPLVDSHSSTNPCESTILHSNSTNSATPARPCTSSISILPESSQTTPFPSYSHLSNTNSPPTPNLDDLTGESLRFEFDFAPLQTILLQPPSALPPTDPLTCIGKQQKQRVQNSPQKSQLNPSRQKRHLNLSRQLYFSRQERQLQVSHQENSKS